MKQLSEQAIEHLDLFTSYTPEQIAISIVLSARHYCKLDESVKHIEAMFGTQINAEIRKCVIIFESFREAEE